MITPVGNLTGFDAFRIGKKIAEYIVGEDRQKRVDRISKRTKIENRISGFSISDMVLSRFLRRRYS